ncbi:hypothetical protein STCU_02303 [Strigomonas culicis]|uniref:CHCH domain-containing protein n=1 Tax=Strigomonas culicis TaxID=28005 RepID=S9WBE7_9TRYP|nr:hypothetical protein STCU_02303 [Strigomonas culicis]|eukprot:EPY33325.1 hypothetical protein STCU_02303 [Strigomonas culicis]
MHIGNLGHSKAQADAHKYYHRSWLTPFFGANVPEAWESFPREIHPCELLNVEVHVCLDKKKNDFAYCQPKVADFQRCLRKYDI